MKRLATLFYLSALVVVSVLGGNVLEGTLGAGSAPHKVKFTLTNKSGVTLKIAKWGTPLLGVFDGPFLDVTSGSEKAVYKGLMTRRTLDFVSLDQLIDLAPNRPIEQEINLQTAFSLKKGTWDIAPKFHIVTVSVGAAATINDTILKEANLTLPKLFAVKVEKSYTLESPKFSVTLEKDLELTPLGTVAASKSSGAKKGSTASTASSAKPKKASSSSLLEFQLRHRSRSRLRNRLVAQGRAASRASYTECTVRQRVVAQDAVDAAKPYIVAAKTYVNEAKCVAHENWKRWFGDTDAAQTARVREVVEQLRTSVDSVTVDCKTGVTNGVCAFFGSNCVGYADRTVAGIFYTCPALWVSTPTVAIETVIHELTHLPPASTLDVDAPNSYGQDVAKGFAKTPAKAVENAENYCYFALDNLPGTC